MNDPMQVELAKVLWEQSRQTAILAHDAWGQVIKSQKSLMDSMRKHGVPFALASEQFEKMMEFHAEQYKAALEHMDKMSAEYKALLDNRADA